MIPVGLPEIQPVDYRKQRFWYTLMALGQLQHRLLKPYQRLPLKMAKLVDTSIPQHRRLDLAAAFCALDKCCLDPLFAQPVIQAARDAGGSHTLVSGTLADDLGVAMRTKTSNMEIELNFARASNARQVTRGRSDTISSMIAKHVSAEVKLGHQRSLRSIQPLACRSLAGWVWQRKQKTATNYMAYYMG